MGRVELETALADNPEDADAWRVYFDWLQAHGDPWGERGSLALACDRASGADQAKLRRQLAEFDAAHSEALFGAGLLELWNAKGFERVTEIEERYGLVWSVRVHCPESHWSGIEPALALAALLESPAARLLHEIRIGLQTRNPPDLQQGVEVLGWAESLPNLRSLSIGDFEYPNANEIGWIENYLSDNQVLRLEQALSKQRLVLGHQRQPDNFARGSYYYASVGE